MLPSTRNARPPNIFFSVRPAFVGNEIADSGGKLFVVSHRASDQADPTRLRDSFEPRASVEAAEHPSYVVAHSLVGDAHLLGHLSGRVSGGEQRERLALARAEPWRVGGGRVDLSQHLD